MGHQTEQLPTFEMFEDDPRWGNGYHAGMELGVHLFHDLTQYERGILDVQSCTALRSTLKRCGVCDSPDAVEIPPRLPGRTAVYLCRKDLAGFTEQLPPFPGDDPNPVNLRDVDDPMWLAGFTTGMALATMMPMSRWARGGEGESGEDRAARLQQMAVNLKRATCTLCPGSLNTWSGFVSCGGVRICGACRVYLRERQALLAWTSGTERAPEPE